VIKKCAGNKQRWLGIKGFSNAWNIADSTEMWETYAEVSYYDLLGFIELFRLYFWIMTWLIPCYDC